MSEDFKSRVRAERGSESRRLFSIKVGVAERTVIRWEEGGSYKPEQLAKLVKATGKPVSYWVGEAPPTYDVDAESEDPTALAEFLESPMGQRTTDDEKAYLRGGQHALYGMTAESYQSLLAAYRASERGRSVTAHRESDAANAEAKSRVAAKGAMAPPKKR